MDKKDVIIATHNGLFHADDVFAVAALLALLDGKPVVAKIIRTRDEQILNSADFAVDVGAVYNEEKNRFDHHQIGGAGTRDNGISYASFGLVWKKFGALIAGNEVIAMAVDKNLASPIDARDTGEDIFELKAVRKGAIRPYLIDDVICSFVPTWRESAVSADGAFLEAVAIARKVIERAIAVAKAREASRGIVLASYKKSSDKRFLVINQNCSWKETVVKLKDVLYVVSPGSFNDSHWEVNAARNDLDHFTNRKNLPAAWAGKRDKELAEITGVPDAIFCHTGRFIAVAKSKEGAIKLAKIALLNN